MRNSTNDSKNEQLQEAIALIIREAGVETFKFPPFETWEELQAARLQHGLEEEAVVSNTITEDMRIALSCIRSFHLYVSNLAFAYFVRLFLRDDVNPKTQAGFTLASGIAADIGAIELLCQSGFDIQAKQILRSLREKVDCLIAVQLDRSFAVNYVFADGSHETNQFWHKRIARGKLRKLISTRLQRLSKSSRSPLGEEWFKRRENFDRWLGEAVHPSHTTGLLSAFPHFGSGAENFSEPGWYGVPSDLSISTIRAVMALAFEIELIVRWRNLIKPNDFDIVNKGNEEGSYFVLHQSIEGLIRQCTANSMFEPNLDILKLQAWISGRMLVQEGEEVDPEVYRLEMYDILLRLLEKVSESISTDLVKPNGESEAVGPS